MRFPSYASIAIQPKAWDCCGASDEAGAGALLLPRSVHRGAPGNAPRVGSRATLTWGWGHGAWLVLS